MKRYLTMKQLISFLAALLFALSLPGGLTAEETEDGDDSEQIPVETMEEDDIEIEESVARVLQYGDEGDDGGTYASEHSGNDAVLLERSKENGNGKDDEKRG